MATDQDESREPIPDDKNKQQQQPRNRLPTWFWLLSLAFAFALNVFVYSPKEQQPVAALPYSDLVTELRADNVARVDLRGMEVSGEFKTPVLLPRAGEPAPEGQKPVEPVAYTKFNSTRPPIDDERLLPLLEEKKVVVTATEITTPWYLELLFSLAPFLLLIGLIAMSTRQMTRATGGMFGFGQSKARVYTADRPEATFADVAGQDQAKAELMEVVDFLKNPEKYARLGARIPRGVLLSGPPGTGKTLLARAVAGEAHVPFFSVNGSEFVEMIVGVGASRVRDLFAKAKAAAPCLIFIDEIDGIGRSRGVASLGGNDEREQTLNQLLVEMDGFDRNQAIIVLAATNRGDVLDRALLRPGRFDRQVAVDLPDREGRTGILRIHTRKIPLEADVELDKLARATPGFSGADLANLANEAALGATRRQADRVSQEDFELALDRIVLGAVRRGIVDPHDRKVVAYHEAGHALVAVFTPGADPVHRVTIIPRGRALGVTAQLPEGERFNYSRTYLLGRLAILLGGRSAEEIAIGDISTGAENDIREAVRLTSMMVSRWGMSDLGLIACQPRQGRGMFPVDPNEACDVSEATQAEIDGEINRLLDEQHEEARRILTENRASLDALADALMKEETVDAERLLEVVEEAQPGIALPNRPTKEEPGLLPTAAATSQPPELSGPAAPRTQA